MLPNSMKPRATETLLCEVGMKTLGADKVCQACFKVKTGTWWTTACHLVW